MGLYRTGGIVLKTRKLGEADKIVVLYSPNSGRVEGVAKGARKATSKRTGCFEPFTILDLVLHEGRSLDTITQVSVVESNRAVREELNRVVYGSAMLDLVDQVAMDNLADEGIYRLLLLALEILKGMDEGFLSLVAAFDLALMGHAGYSVEFDICASCGRELGDKGHFGYDSGGFLCDNCREFEPGARAVRHLGRIRELAVAFCLAPAESAALFAASDPKVEREVLDAVEEYVKSYLQVRLKSRELIRPKR